MSFLDVPQGRALAIILPSVTLMAHTATFVVFEAVFAGTWGSSWCAMYDLVAAAASAVGILGAFRRRRVLIATYLFVHTVTLSLISAVLLINLFPSVFVPVVQFASHFRYGKDLESRMCQELDSGFGGDHRWLSDCASSFSTLITGVMWVGVFLMAAQWLVLMNVWNWLRERPSNAYDRKDLEKRQESGISQDYKA